MSLSAGRLALRSRPAAPLAVPSDNRHFGILANELLIEGKETPRSREAWGAAVWSVERKCGVGTRGYHRTEVVPCRRSPRDGRGFLEANKFSERCRIRQPRRSSPPWVTCGQPDRLANVRKRIGSESGVTVPRLATSSRTSHRDQRTQTNLARYFLLKPASARTRLRWHMQCDPLARANERPGVGFEGPYLLGYFRIC